jgi:putative component of toxin-antitoxin plasmid stabilization module
MPRTLVLLFCDSNGRAPLIEWLKDLPEKVQDKCVARIRRLAGMGHELRRPEADFLRDGIYELRVGFGGVNYRMLYFFHGNIAAIVCNGLMKEREVPPIEIERAIARRKQYLTDPLHHSLEMNL